MASREERRLDILKAAVQVFSEHGLHKAKIEDIAKLAGIGKGTVYEYFDSKKSLFQEMVKYIIQKYKNGLREIFKDKTSVKEKIIKYGEFNGKYLSNHMDMVNALASRTEMLPKEMKYWVAEIKLEINNLMEQMIDDGVSSGELREDIHKETAILCIIGTMNQYYAKKVFVERMDYRHIDINPIIDILFKGLSND